MCPVCFWEDDCEDPNSPNWDVISDLNNDFTLREARKNFVTYGAWQEKFKEVVISHTACYSLIQQIRKVTNGE